jgi:hypothetical protein
MHGWITVAIIAGVQLAIVIFMMYRASSRWWHYVVIFALAVPFLRVSLLYTGDVGHHFPQGSFSDDADGKDQIIVASASSTVLQALMMSAFTFGILRACWLRWRGA